MTFSESNTIVPGMQLTHNKLSICIVTAECIGPFKNGGIGTSMTGLAEVLANAGHLVTLYYTRGIHLTNSQIKYWTNVYKNVDVKFVALRQKDIPKFIGPLSELGYTIPCAILDYLKYHHFDVVHFNDTDAEGFLAIAAHRLCGLAPSSHFLLAMHSPREWVYESNRVPANIPVDALMQYTERLSAELIDVMWCPSRYLIEWIKSKKWKLSRNIIQQQYVMPSRQIFKQTDSNNNIGNIPSSHVPSTLNTIVFFGRLEERKGLRLFLDSICKILQIIRDANIKVVFLGRAVKINGKSSKSFISEYVKNWDLNWEIISNYGQQEAINYLLKQGRLAVMPSPSDNSPCTVYEAIEAGIPFLAARTGGIPELIHSRDSDRVLFDYNTESLAKALCSAIENNIRCVRPSIRRDENIMNWRKLHSTLKPIKKVNSIKKIDSTLILIEDISTLEALAITLDSLKKSEAIIEDILIVTAKADDYYKSLGGIKTILPGELINYIKRMSERLTNVSLFCIYSDIQLAPFALERLLISLSNSMADGIIPSSNIEGSYQCYPFGGNVALSFIYGPASTGAVLLGPKAIYKAFECNTDADSGPFGGIADRALVSGANIWPYPKTILELSKKTLSKLQPEITISRIKLYSQVNDIDREALLLIAASTTKDGLITTLMRIMGYRLMRSRFNFLFPIISRLKNIVN